MEIRNLKNIPFDTLFQAFGQAFADYEIKFGKDELFSMLQRRGFVSGLSFAAFNEGDIIAFTFNGIGTYNGLLTAYDTGTGTRKEFRGQGIAPKIFRHSLPFLREAGVRQYLLEVLQNNTQAIAVYRKLGFEVTQEFLCFRQAKDRLKHLTTPCHPASEPIEIIPTGTDIINGCASFRDFNPSWQNNAESIARGRSGLKALGAMTDGNMVGYCIFDPATGDLSQIAVSPGYRRKKIASALFREAVAQSTSGTIKVLNVNPLCTSMPAFLKSRNMAPAAHQFEMILSL